MCNTMRFLCNASLDIYIKCLMKIAVLKRALLIIHADGCLYKSIREFTAFVHGTINDVAVFGKSCCLINQQAKSFKILSNRSYLLLDFLLYYWVLRTECNFIDSYNSTTLQFS